MRCSWLQIQESRLVLTSATAELNFVKLDVEVYEELRGISLDTRLYMRCVRMRNSCHVVL
jgi:hypothetical protein